MNCPKCGIAVSSADPECPRCGVIFEKASPHVPLHHAPAANPPTSRPSSIDPSAIFWGIAVVIVVAGFAWRTISARAPVVPLPETSSTWYLGASGYDRALEEQKTTSKPVLVYFHTEWCGYCKLLEQDVFSTGSFQSRYSSILKVKLNPEHSRGERELGERYSVRAFPTVLVIANGAAREPIVGYAPPDQYLEALRHSIGD
jgi:thiol:disulfide interchange protein